MAGGFKKGTGYGEWLRLARAVRCANAALRRHAARLHVATVALCALCAGPQQ